MLRLNRLIKGDRDEADRADCPGVYQFFDLQETLQRPAVIGHIKRKFGRAAGINHLLAFSEVHRHWLLDIDRLARFRRRRLEPSQKCRIRY